MALSLERRFNRYPPIVCRLLARQGRRGYAIPLTDRQIAQRSGLAVSDVKALSWKTTWNDVTVSTMFSFSKACGVDFSSRDNMNLHTKYIKSKNRWLYLRRDKEWATRWLPMLQLYSEHVEERLRKAANHGD